MLIERSYISDVDLDGGVVLGGDESVGGGAFSGDIKVHDFVVGVLHIG